VRPSITRPGSKASSVNVGLAKPSQAHEGIDVQSTRPRDLEALLFVVGLFAVLLLTSLTLGSPHFR
jgi:hypothetical protein